MAARLCLDNRRVNQRRSLLVTPADRLCIDNSRVKQRRSLIVIPAACLCVDNRRVNQRRGLKVTPAALKYLTLKDVNFSLYWHAYMLWVRRIKESQTVITAIPSFEVIQNGDWRGDFICVKLTIESNMIPAWFPAFNEVPVDDRNFLHMSICFSGDIDKMASLEDQALAHQYIAELKTDDAWNGERHETCIARAAPHGTFHLKGFDNDQRMTWLHKHGSYWQRPFGHIALYMGGLHV